MSEIAIQIEGLSKQYRLGQVGTGTLSHDLNRWWCRLRGRPDPTLPVTESNVRAEAGRGGYVWALRDVNMEVGRGEVLGIIGANGAGKSTLLKILSRVTAPTAGCVKVRGRIASLLEVGTGFQPELTGRENVYLNGAILGMTAGEVARKFDEIVAFSGCERYIDTPVKRYSSGMIVRLGFAVAAHLDPDILVVDEVLAVGDAEFQQKCIGRMQAISHTEGRTVLLVTHNMGTVEALADRVVLLKEGRAECCASVAAGVALYLGRGAGMSSAEYRNEARPGTGPAVIRSARVLDAAGQVGDRLPTCEPFSIEMEWENLEGCAVTPHIRLVRHDGVKAVALNDACVDWDGRAKATPGVYRSRVHVPANWLNAGQFTVDVSLLCSSPFMRLAREDGAMSFALWDPMDRRCLGRGNFSYQAYAVMMPALSWEWEKLS